MKIGSMSRVTTVRRGIVSCVVQYTSDRRPHCSWSRDAHLPDITVTVIRRRYCLWLNVAMNYCFIHCQTS